MGVWGWDEIKDNQTMKGFVNNKPTYFGDDGDWSFNVRPALGFKSLLMNPSLKVNTNSQVECEFEPPDNLNGDDTRSQPAVNKHLANFKDNWVTVRGTWVRDRSHTYYGGSIGLGDDQSEGKTEIHPVKSILLERPPAANNKSRVVEIYVVSDDSGETLASVPHSDENVQATFSIPVRLGSKIDSEVKVKKKVDKAKSTGFSIKDSGGVSIFEAKIASGKASDGQGYFHATVELPGFTLLSFLLSREVKAGIGVRELMSRAFVKSVRALFNRLEAGTLQSAQCTKLTSEVATLQTNINNLVEQMDILKKGGSGTPGKPTQDPAFKELMDEKKKLEADLKPLNAKAKSLGCQKP